MFERTEKGEKPDLLFFGRVLSSAGKIFFTFVAPDRGLVDRRVRTVWEVSRRMDAGATFFVDPLGDVIP